FVGSLAYTATDDDLAAFFADAGTVTSAKVIIDRDTNRSKGFGFVEMSSDEEAKAAIDSLNGKDLNGRPVALSEARPKAPRESGSFNGNSY
ncbi:MAG TPA: RNA-binding protein, partial [Candidatus Saccharimonadales bacterium]|nr:RNA-binding protein [Candidatus Saccharimonadales bacterium]